MHTLWPLQLGCCMVECCLHSLPCSSPCPSCVVLAAVQGSGLAEFGQADSSDLQQARVHVDGRHSMKLTAEFLSLQVVMTACTLVWSYVAMPINPDKRPPVLSVRVPVDNKAAWQVVWGEGIMCSHLERHLSRHNVALLITQVTTMSDCENRCTHNDKGPYTASPIAPSF